VEETNHLLKTYTHRCEGFPKESPRNLPLSVIASLLRSIRRGNLGSQTFSLRTVLAKANLGLQSVLAKANLGSQIFRFVNCVGEANLGSQIFRFVNCVGEAKLVFLKRKD